MAVGGGGGGCNMVGSRAMIWRQSKWRTAYIFRNPSLEQILQFLSRQLCDTTYLLVCPWTTRHIISTIKTSASFNTSRILTFLGPII
jgi:hypothetical protein